METLVLHTHVDAEGHVTLTLPAGFANQAIEIVVRRSPIVTPKLDEPVDALGWPIGYFEALDNMPGDDIIERPEQGDYEEREPLE
jgi:hypothetical protein